MTADVFAALDLAIEEATPATAAPLVAAVAARQAKLAAKLLEAPREEQQDRLLSIEETATRMGVSERYLYRRANTLPFARREGRRVLFSERGLARHLERGA